MKFKPCVAGATAFSSLVGTLDVSYFDLERVFGPPHSVDNPDGRTKAEWGVRFEDGTVATIYDYRSGVEAADNREWHIGGFGREAVDRVNELLTEFGIQFEELR